MLISRDNLKSRGNTPMLAAWQCQQDLCHEKTETCQIFLSEIHPKPVRGQNDHCVRAKAFSVHKTCIYHRGRGVFQERLIKMGESYILPFCNEDGSENLCPLEIIWSTLKDELPCISECVLLLWFKTTLIMWRPNGDWCQNTLITYAEFYKLKDFCALQERWWSGREVRCVSIRTSAAICSAWMQGCRIPWACLFAFCLLDSLLFSLVYPRNLLDIPKFLLQWKFFHFYVSGSIFQCLLSFSPQERCVSSPYGGHCHSHMRVLGCHGQQFWWCWCICPTVGAGYNW